MARDFLKLEARKQQIEVATWRSVEDMRCRRTVESVQRAASLTHLDRRFQIEEGERARTLERNQLIRDQASLYQRQVGAQVKLGSEPGSVRSNAMEKIRDSREQFAGQVERMSGEWHKAIEDQMKQDIKKARDDASHCLLRQNEMLHAARRQEQLLEELFAERQRMQEERSKLYALDKEMADRNQALRDRLEQEREENERSVIDGLGVAHKKEDRVEKNRSVIEQPLAPASSAPSRRMKEEGASMEYNNEPRPVAPRPVAVMETEAKPYVPRKGTRQFEVYQRLKNYEMEMISDLRLLEGMPTLSSLPSDRPKTQRHSPRAKTFESETRAPVVYVPTPQINQPQPKITQGAALIVTRREAVEQSPIRSFSRFEHSHAEVQDHSLNDHARSDSPDIQHRAVPPLPPSNAEFLAAVQPPIASPSTFDIHAPIPSLSDMGLASLAPQRRPNEQIADGRHSDILMGTTSPRADVVENPEAKLEIPGNSFGMVSSAPTANQGRDEKVVTQPYWPYDGPKVADARKDDDASLKSRSQQDEKETCLKSKLAQDDPPLHTQLPPVTPYSPSHSVDFAPDDFHISSSGEPNLDNWIPNDVTSARLNKRNQMAVDPRMDGTLQSSRSMSFSPGELNRDMLSPPVAPGVGSEIDNSSVLRPQAMGTLEQTPSFLRAGIESSMGEVRPSGYGGETLTLSHTATNTAEGSFSHGVFETSQEEVKPSNQPIISNADLMKGFRNDVQVRAEDLRSPRKGEGQTSARSDEEHTFGTTAEAYFQKMETTSIADSLANRSRPNSMLGNNVPKLPETGNPSSDIGGHRPWQDYDTRPAGWSRAGTPSMPSSLPSSARAFAEKSEQQGRGGDLATDDQFSQNQAESPMSTGRRQDDIISAIARSETVPTKTAETPQASTSKRTPWASDGGFMATPGKEVEEDEIDDSDDEVLGAKLPLPGGRLGTVESRRISTNSKPPQASRPSLNSFDIGRGFDELSESEDAFKRSEDLPSDDGLSSAPRVPRKMQNPLGRSKSIARSNSQNSDEFGFTKSTGSSNSPAGVTKTMGYASSLGRASILSNVKSKLNNQRASTSNLLGLPIDWNQAESHR